MISLNKLEKISILWSSNLWWLLTISFSQKGTQWLTKPNKRREQDQSGNIDEIFSDCWVHRTSTNVKRSSDICERGSGRHSQSHQSWLVRNHSLYACCLALSLIIILLHYQQSSSRISESRGDVAPETTTPLWVHLRVALVYLQIQQHANWCDATFVNRRGASWRVLQSSKFLRQRFNEFTILHKCKPYKMDRPEIYRLPLETLWAIIREVNLFWLEEASLTTVIDWRYCRLEAPLVGVKADQRGRNSNTLPDGHTIPKRISLMWSSYSSRFSWLCQKTSTLGAGLCLGGSVPPKLHRTMSAFCRAPWGTYWQPAHADR